MINPSDTFSANNYICTIREDGHYDYKDIVAPPKKRKSFPQGNVFNEHYPTRTGVEMKPDHSKKIGYLISDFLSASISRGNLRAKSLL